MPMVGSGPGENLPREEDSRDAMRTFNSSGFESPPKARQKSAKSPRQHVNFQLPF